MGRLTKKSDYPWIAFSIERGAAFCFPCCFFAMASDDLLTHADSEIDKFHSALVEKAG